MSEMKGRESVRERLRYRRERERAKKWIKEFKRQKQRKTLWNSKKEIWKRDRNIKKR